MNVYEDKYLREKVNRIIARQKEGKFVIAAYKDGSGLTTSWKRRVDNWGRMSLNILQHRS